MYKKIFFSAVLLLGTLCATAQTNGSNSPYSRYGYGLQNDQAQGFNKGMAGLAYGMNDAKQLNFKNPASYAAIDSLTMIFDIGFTLQKANLELGGVKKNANNSSVDYVMAGFRLAPNLGMTLGLMPYTTIGYNMSTRPKQVETTRQELTQTDVYKGEGGLREVFFGLGYRPTPKLSVGANVGYLWGTMENIFYAPYSDNTDYNRHFYTADIRTFKVDFGVQYEHQVNSKNWLVVGATYGLGHNVNRPATFIRQLISASQGATGDTTRISNAFELPHTFGLGATWNHRNRLRVGFDYTLQLWDGCRTPELINNEYQVSTNSFTNSHTSTLGGEYVRRPNSAYWYQQIRYRVGLSMSTPYTKVNGVDGPRRYTASLGLGIPIRNGWNNRSVVNIAAQYERVEPKFSGMITENYFRLCLGITFNEMWFSKWKVR
jgi:hypothetical protein